MQNELKFANRETRERGLLQIGPIQVEDADSLIDAIRRKGVYFSDAGGVDQVIPFPDARGITLMIYGPGVKGYLLDADFSEISEDDLTSLIDQIVPGSGKIDIRGSHSPRDGMTVVTRTVILTIDGKTSCRRTQEIYTANGMKQCLSSPTPLKIVTKGPTETGRNIYARRYGSAV